jgi:hypothetical protein
MGFLEKTPQKTTNRAGRVLRRFLKRQSIKYLFIITDFLKTDLQG